MIVAWKFCCPSADSPNSHSSLTLRVKIATIDTETTLMNETTDFEYTTVEPHYPSHFPGETTHTRPQPEVKPEVSDIDDRENEQSTLRSSSKQCRADDTVRCHDGSRYICSVQQCDGVPDCDDGGDEVDCPHPGTAGWAAWSSPRIGIDIKYRRSGRTATRHFDGCWKRWKTVLKLLQ